MVTTRRGAGVDVPGETPRSSAKRARGKRELRELEIEGTPTAAKRRRKSAAEAQNGAGTEEDVFDAVAVAIPDRTRGKSKSPNNEEREPFSRRGSPKVVIPKKPSSHTSPEGSPTKGALEDDLVPTQETAFHTPGATQASSVYATPAIQLERQGSPTPTTGAKAKKSTPASTRRSARQTKKAESLVETKDVAPTSSLPDEIPSSTWESDQAPIATQVSVPASTPTAKKLHTRFGSEELVDFPSSFEMNMQGHALYDHHGAPEGLEANANEAQFDDSASDSDEAPEVVTAATAASKAKAAAEETSRAHQAQQQKDTRRKQKRAERIAEEQAERRKREEKKARKLAKLQSRESRAKRPASTPPRAPLDVDMSNLPALLPDSILEAVGDRRPPTPPPVRTSKTAEQIQKEKLSRHIKFLERGDKPIKDMTKGSVNVSVLAQQNALLAPKVNRNTTNIREHWLKGRQQEKRGKKAMSKGQFKKMERRAVGGGFLRGGDE
ncbi:hypothetical protein K458DRAFT_321428 [Lentithecium fluviatile CBS 122367]|uniref:Uncharacterized protein n=1 Tax=Lentithecium fluviatile CBS 122367 TaxID=1168545 RepID=A0A6G1IEM3_9PLEO|nr:hypothetical protein K458DRAFT_321428 [Lentithecium fluviatile CBS 122367]